MAGSFVGFDYGKYKLNIIIKMSVESFKCPKCGKFTRHIDVGFQGGLNAEMRSDKSNSVGRKLFANVFGGFSDYTGVSKLVGGVLGRGTYKCCECGMVAIWNKDGTIFCIEYWPD